MFNLFRLNLIDLPISYSINYYWSYGFVLSMFMCIQIITGVVLSFLYISDSSVSFFNVTSLSNDSFFTWCLRYLHIIGVNVLFILVFIHICRSLYYSSYTKVGVWNIGFILYLLMMGEAFTGYILPWHQMSYWAATVLTSIVDSLPVVGHSIYKYVVGGFSITGDTLSRVLSIHICLGFIVIMLMVVHLFYLHKDGSSNSLYSYSMLSDVVYFHSYFTVKDLFLFMSILTGVLSWLLLSPDLLVDIESYLEADQLNTPVSIKPEWYFLAFYAMLRCISSKVGGLMLVLCFLVFLWVPTSSISTTYSIFRQVVFWFIICLFVSLTYLGTCHPEYPYLLICQVFSVSLVFMILILKLL
uniref:Cytochrome b n=1 Tax=Hydatigera krepkogorski TaxID=1434709 RepID=N0DMM0_9CEST|nr:cytochrome b [Hydatigera krepkogorski]BAN15679.1 cytochrome b [Hydatigera krepkogorski]